MAESTVVQHRQENGFLRFARSFLPILTFGDVITTDLDDDPVPRLHTYNGFISSMVLFISTASIAFTMSLCLPIGAKLNNVVASCATLITLMMFGIGAMVWLSASHSRGRSRRESGRVAQMHDGSGFGHLINRLLRDNISLIGITLFFVLSCVPEVLHIIAPANCADVWTLCVPEVVSNNIVKMIFHIVRIVYIGAELIFCYQFRRFRFRDQWPIRCALMMIQSANLSLWFDAVIWEGTHGGVDNKGHLNCGYDFQNHTDVKIGLCLNETTYEYTILNNNIIPYFYPFIIEFTLLVGDCFGHLFFQCTSVGARRITSRPNESIQTDDCDESDSEETPLIVESEGRRSLKRALITKICLVVGVLINVTFCILAFLSGWEYNKISSDKPFLQEYVEYCVFHELTQVACIVLGYIFARSMRPTGTPFSGLDYLVILSAGGSLMGHFFTVVAVDGLNKLSMWNGTTFVAEHGATYEIFLSAQVINAVEVFLQVTFVFFAERVTVSRVAGPDSYAVSFFKAMLLYLAVCNCSNWLVDSFMVKNFSLEPDYFNNWNLISNVLTTLRLFFRFSSFLYFIRAFLNN